MSPKIIGSALIVGNMIAMLLLTIVGSNPDPMIFSISGIGLGIALFE